MEQVIIRVRIPECSLEDAVKVKQAIDEAVKKVPNATVELNTMPVRAKPPARP